MNKKTLFASAFLFVALYCSAEWNVTTEVQNKNVLIEEFTGIHCGYCPQAHAIVEELLKVQGDKVCAVAFHAGSYAVPASDEPDFRLVEGEAINNHFAISSYPAGMVNRQRNSDYIVLNRTSWADYAHTESEKPASVNLYMSSSYDTVSRMLTVDVEGYYTADVESDCNMLNVIVTESNVMGPQRGGGVGDEYMHQHMARLFLTPIWGDTIVNCRAGEYFKKQYTCEVPVEINEVAVNPAELEVVAFVSENRENILNVTTCRPQCSDFHLPLKAEIVPALIPVSDTYGVDYFEIGLNNKSTENITSADFIITFNKVDYEVSWSGLATPREITYIKLPFELVDNMVEVSNKYIIKLTALNGNEYKGNKLNGKFDAPYTATPTVKFEITTDNRPDENRFIIKDVEGNVVYEFGPYSAGEVVRVAESVSLTPNTTYSFEVIDVWSNGISGDGAFTLLDAYGNMICEENVIENHGCRLFFTTTDRNVSMETENKKMLIEEFTGIHCGNCPDAHELIDELFKAQGDNLYALAYHAGGYANPFSSEPDYRTPMGDSLDIYFKPDGYPNGMVNRNSFDTDTYMHGRGMWAAYGRTIVAQAAPVNIWVNSIYDSETRLLTIDVEGYYTADVDADFNLLNVVVTQSNIKGPQGGGGMGNNYVHNHMVRANITPMWGDTIAACRQGDFFKKQYRYTVPEDINGVVTDPAHFEVVAFVAVDETDILNVAGCRPEYPGLQLPMNAEIEAYRLPVNGGTYGYDYYEAYFRNNSTELVSSAIFTITLNDTEYQAEWLGTVAPRSTVYIQIPFEQNDLLKNSNDYVVRLSGINGEEHNGNSFEGSFQDPVATTPLNKFIIKTDNYADENRYVIKDATGKIVHEFGPYPTGTVNEVTEEVELSPDKVYTFEVTDAWANGILNPRGSYKIYNANGKIIAQNLEIKEHGCRTAFATTETASVNISDADKMFEVYYNRTDAIVVNPAHNNPYTVALYNAAGQCVGITKGMQGILIPVNNPGVYMVKITTDTDTEVVKISVR